MSVVLKMSDRSVANLLQELLVKVGNLETRKLCLCDTGDHLRCCDDEHAQRLEHLELKINNLEREHNQKLKKLESFYKTNVKSSKTDCETLVRRAEITSGQVCFACGSNEVAHKPVSLPIRACRPRWFRIRSKMRNGHICHGAEIYSGNPPRDGSRHAGGKHTITTPAERVIQVGNFKQDFKARL